MSCKHFIENDSDSPDIAFRAVKVIIECFDWHINWGSYIIVAGFFEIWVANGESEVSYLNFAFTEEDIGWFKISMYNSESIDASISIDYLFEDSDGLSLRDSFANFDHFSEVASLAEFSGYAGVSFKGDDVIEFDDVLEVAEHSEYFDLVIEESFMHFSFDILHIYKFEGKGLSLVKGMVPLV